MNTYLMIAKLKPEDVDKYRMMHKTCHTTEYRDQLDAIKNCGCKQMLTFLWKDYSLLYAECEGTIEEFFEALGETDANKKWSSVTGPWFADKDDPEHRDFIPPLEKIFDLQQQLKGELKPY